VHAAPGGDDLPIARAAVGLVVAAAVALLLATADPLLALLPAALAVAAYAVVRLPVRVPLFALLALAVLADLEPSRAPEIPPWRPPTHVLQPLLLDNLNKLLGVEAAKVSGFEVVALALIALAALRALAGDRTDAAGRVPPARPMVAALLLSLFAVVALEAWGVARGGDVRQSLWQFRYVLWMPVLALLLCAAMRGARDAAAFAAAVTGVSCLKILLAAYFYFRYARPAGVTPATVTSHADSVLFVVTMVGWLAAAYHQPTVRRVAAAAAVAAWSALGLAMNNRRTAYVTLAATAVMFYAVLPRRTRRALLRLGLYALPLFLVYVAAGRNRAGAAFAPARMVASVITQEDASSQTRDIENYNLVTTLKRGPLVGSGWGHEYVEISVAYNIAHVFPQYRYIAHNSVLWLWSIGGLVGFTLLWLPVAAGAFLAARAHAFATTPLDRGVAYGALATYAAYVVQAWADMGTQSWTVQGMLAVALAASAKLAVGTGAWPQRTRLFGAAAPHVGGA
jgi:hypothetical protein